MRKEFAFLAPLTVRVEFWMADRLGCTQMGPMIIEESLDEGDSLRSLLNRLAGRFREFPEAVFDPQTQSLSSEVAVVINDQIQNLSQGLETRLKPRDRILFLPILAGG